jgi:maltooligosyltrehalose trehalohydrolase
MPCTPLWTCLLALSGRIGRGAHLEGERLNRRIYLMAESDLNDVRLLRPRELGGCDLDAHWNDDFHHALHTLLTGE